MVHKERIISGMCLNPYGYMVIVGKPILKYCFNSSFISNIHDLISLPPDGISVATMFPRFCMALLLVHVFWLLFIFIFLSGHSF